MKKHYAVMVAAVALVAALAIAIPALGSSGGGANAHASKKKKSKKGPVGPQGPAGPAGAAAPTLPHGTGTNLQDLNLTTGLCHVSQFVAPGVRAGDVVAVDIAANSGFEISASAGNNTLQNPDLLNVMICNAGTAHDFTPGSITVGFAVVAR